MEQVKSIFTKHVYLGEDNLAVRIDEAGTFKFIGCSGEVNVANAGARVFATDCPDLKIINIIGAQTYRNGFANGAIYQCDGESNPLESFGGMWERCSAGRVLVGFDGNDSDFNVSKKIGGSKVHAHSLNSGYAKISFNNPTGIKEVNCDEIVTEYWTPTEGRKLSGTAEPTANTSRYATRLGGSSENEKTLMPYYVVNTWRRIHSDGQE